MEKTRIEFVVTFGVLRGRLNENQCKAIRRGCMVDEGVGGLFEKMIQFHGTNVIRDEVVRVTKAGFDELVKGMRELGGKATVEVLPGMCVLYFLCGGKVPEDIERLFLVRMLQGLRSNQLANTRAHMMVVSHMVCRQYMLKGQREDEVMRDIMAAVVVSGSSDDIATEIVLAVDVTCTIGIGCMRGKNPMGIFLVNRLMGILLQMYEPHGGAFAVLPLDLTLVPCLTTLLQGVMELDKPPPPGMVTAILETLNTVLEVMMYSHHNRHHHQRENHNETIATMALIIIEIVKIVRVTWPGECGDPQMNRLFRIVLDALVQMAYGSVLSTERNRVVCDALCELATGMATDPFATAEMIQMIMSIDKIEWWANQLGCSQYPLFGMWSVEPLCAIMKTTILAAQPAKLEAVLMHIMTMFPESLSFCVRALCDVPINEVDNDTKAVVVRVLTELTLRAMQHELGTHSLVMDFIRGQNRDDHPSVVTMVLDTIESWIHGPHQSEIATQRQRRVLLGAKTRPVEGAITTSLIGVACQIDHGTGIPAIDSWVHGLRTQECTTTHTCHGDKSDFENGELDCMLEAPESPPSILDMFTAWCCAIPGAINIARDFMAATLDHHPDEMLAVLALSCHLIANGCGEGLLALVANCVRITPTVARPSYCDKHDNPFRVGVMCLSVCTAARGIHLDIIKELIRCAWRCFDHQCKFGGQIDVSEIGDCIHRLIPVLCWLNRLTGIETSDVIAALTSSILACIRGVTLNCRDIEQMRSLCTDSLRAHTSLISDVLVYADVSDVNTMCECADIMLQLCRHLDTTNQKTPIPMEIVGLCVADGLLVTLQVQLWQEGLLVDHIIQQTAIPIDSLIGASKTHQVALPPQFGLVVNKYRDLIANHVLRQNCTPHHLAIIRSFCRVLEEKFTFGDQPMLTYTTPIHQYTDNQQRHTNLGTFAATATTTTTTTAAITQTSV